MVEQFNKAKHGEVQHTNHSVEITGPIINYQPGITEAPVKSTQTPPKQRSLSPQQETYYSEQSMWKSNPIFASSDDDDDDNEDEVPEIIKRLSQNGLSGKQLSDTLSSDMIVNSISTGSLLK